VCFLLQTNAMLVKSIWKQCRGEIKISKKWNEGKVFSCKISTSFLLFVGWKISRGKDFLSSNPKFFILKKNQHNNYVSLFFFSLECLQYFVPFHVRWKASQQILFYFIFVIQFLFAIYYQYVCTHNINVDYVIPLVRTFFSRANICSQNIISIIFVLSLTHT
jgi:hypothetical protein